MIARTVRRSRRLRFCDGCRNRVEVGDLYLDCRASPHHDDLGNPGWWRLIDCEECATRRGNGHLFATREVAAALVDGKAGHTWTRREETA